MCENKNHTHVWEFYTDLSPCSSSEKCSSLCDSVNTCVSFQHILYLCIQNALNAIANVYKAAQDCPEPPNAKILFLRLPWTTQCKKLFLCLSSHQWILSRAWLHGTSKRDDLPILTYLPWYCTIRYGSSWHAWYDKQANRKGEFLVFRSRTRARVSMHGIVPNQSYQSD